MFVNNPYSTYKLFILYIDTVFFYVMYIIFIVILSHRTTKRRNTICNRYLMQCFRYITLIHCKTTMYVWKNNYSWTLSLLYFIFTFTSVLWVKCLLISLGDFTRLWICVCFYGYSQCIVFHVKAIRGKEVFNGSECFYDKRKQIIKDCC
jgi:hypothetical protein